MRPQAPRLSRIWWDRLAKPPSSIPCGPPRPPKRAAEPRRRHAAPPTQPPRAPPHPQPSNTSSPASLSADGLAFYFPRRCKRPRRPYRGPGLESVSPDPRVPRTCEDGLIWKWDLGRCDQVKVRSGCIKSKRTSILIRGRAIQRRHTREGPAQAGNGGMHP